MNNKYDDEPSRKIWQRILMPHERKVLYISIPAAVLIGLIAIIAVIFL